MPDDLEAIYREQVRNLLYSQSEFQKHLGEEQSRANDYHREIKGHRDRIAELRTQIQNLLSLFHEGQVKKEAFASYHDPLYNELQQREQSLAEVQSKIDLLGMDTLNNEQVIQDARDLYSLWETFSQEDKRTIIESITEVITIGKEDIEIKLNAIPTLYKGSVPTEPSIPGSIQLLTIAAPNTSSKLVQLSTNSLVGR
ncbi:MAG: hypothetical protein M0D57_04590 [Sphingobacteriales bacterium JAD_PAG50586_3]|nr:MAG: hypothetical protein M0D57_04590 [Sphingobacteriales bacterium JAD_PAG50586_3]